MNRVLSAIVLIAVVVGVVVYAPSWATLLLAMAAAALGGAELARLATTAGSPIEPLHTAIAAAVVCAAVARDTLTQFFGAIGLSGGEAVLILLILGAVALVLTAGAPSPALFGRAALAVFAPLYLGFPLGLLAQLHHKAGPTSLMWFLVVLAVSDTAQYYSGRNFGRRKLAPVISPAKTVEGAIGGLTAAAIAGAAFNHYGALFGGVLALVLAIVGIAGDLFESMLKRSAGAKDSAALIPGHGGVLDRIDSYLLAAPCYYAALTIVRPHLGAF